jgi:hypothetical protein
MLPELLFVDFGEGELGVWHFYGGGEFADVLFEFVAAPDPDGVFCELQLL